MRKIFNNAEEVFAYYANLNGDFKVVEEAFKTLQEDNKKKDEIIASLGKRAVTETVARIKNEEALSMLGKQLVETRLNNMKGGN